MATRFADSLTVVSSAPTSPRPSLRITCSIHALSLPLLQETRIFIWSGSLEDVRMQATGDELDPFTDTWSRNDGGLLIDEVDAVVLHSRNCRQRLPRGNLPPPQIGWNRIA